MTNRHSSRLARVERAGFRRSLRHNLRSRLSRVERAVAPPADDGPTIIWGTGPDARISRGPRPHGSPIVLWGDPPPNDANLSPNQ